MSTNNNNINNNNNKTFYTIIAFTFPKLIDNQYSAIASSHYLVKPPLFSFNSDIMFNRLNLVYNSELKIIIITNTENKLKIYKIGNSLSSKFTVFMLPSKDFYNKNFINDAFLNNNNINHSIFIFENLDYREVVANLAMFNIIVSGGSNSKKHILSPIQLRLARFVIAISTFSGSEVADSFHFERPSGKSGEDWIGKSFKSIFPSINDDFRDKFIHHRNELENKRKNRKKKQINKDRNFRGRK